ncbi:MAG: hypothetical protein NTV46_11595 [Verrucomicrobia bacterium]|nr:hypothetical protein [Verrucomicrobiota bacterium]
MVIPASRMTTEELLALEQETIFREDLQATLIRQPNIRVLPEPPELETVWHQLAAIPSASPE